MRRFFGIGWPTMGVAGLLSLALGCAATTDERMKMFNDDGVSMFGQGRYREAVESFEVASTLTPNDPHLLFNMGQCHDRLGEWKKAETYYQECLSRDKNHPDARHALANLCYRTGRVDQANKMIDDWLTQEGGPVADGYVLDAWRLRQEKDLPKAMDRLQRAVSMEPRNPRALIEMGIVFEMMNMPDRSLVLYERAAQIQPTNADVRNRIESLKAKGVQRALLDQ
ncbi:MAG: tetratricopeptide repeat protein [Gemmataceae bacterium]|nr:tetratricopeptide repeat protein [Gemmataceae bacterium]